MKTKTILILALAAACSGIFGIEVLNSSEAPTGCQKIADIKAGDLFNRHTKDIAKQSIIDDAIGLGAQKVSLELISHMHPKLGKSYSARGIAWACNR